MTWWMVGIGAAGLVNSVVQGHKADKATNKQLKMAQDQQQNLYKNLEPWGQKFLTQGDQNMTAYQHALQQQIGSRQGAMEYATPDINRMAQQQQGAVAAQRSLYPRGGSAAQAANLPFQLQGNINNLLFENKRQAQGQLGQLGNNQASLGLSAMGQGAGLTNSMLQYGLDARQQMLNQGLALGQGIGGLGQLALQYYNSRPTNTNPSIQAGGGTYSGPGLFSGYMGQQSNGVQNATNATSAAYDIYNKIPWG